MLPSRVSLYEVGPRDGLQNESANLTLDAKLRLQMRAEVLHVHRRMGPRRCTSRTTRPRP